MKFSYKKRDRSSLEDRKERLTKGDRDSFVKGDVTWFKTAEKNKIRVLPPTWEDPDHYGYDIWVHYNIGGEKAAYLCLYKMKGEKCPICEEVVRLAAEGKTKEAKALEPKNRLLVYLIDRAEEKVGPKIWTMPPTVDREVVLKSDDEDTGEVLEVDNPKKGYDIKFNIKGKGINSEYYGVDIARTESVLTTDDKLYETWLTAIIESPLPSILNFYDYKHINDVFSASISPDAEEVEEEEDKKESPKKESKPEKENIPEKEEKREEKEDFPFNKDDVEDMKRSELEDVAKKYLDMDEKEIDSLGKVEIRTKILAKFFEESKEEEEMSDAERKLKETLEKLKKGK